MTNKTIIAGFVALAFLVGTITTTFASAAPPENNPGTPFDAILEKLDAILAAIGTIDISNVELNPTTQTQIDNIESEVINIEGKLDGTVPSLVTDIKTETDKIQMIKDSIDNKVELTSESKAAFAQDGGIDNTLSLLRVEQGGVGVGGLTISDFSMTTQQIGPAGCSAMKIDNIQAHGPTGSYFMELVPFVNTWCSGTYIATLTVDTGSGVDGTLVKITVP